MTSPKARINAKGLKYWVVTNGSRNVIFREDAIQPERISICGWIGSPENGIYLLRQARNMWDELIRLGFWLEENPYD